ncbi:MAG: hypothetical protein A2942_04040 [Candidatus Lloydbacteria bacterium RIFCSPLOWO2_01_FULL_50_20]|uniref:Uncharacterized protein n=1 Tax=Candidatus Lloydbacteria bacterium RIFCSPLOWO2_01_FULL_50_20 TaxID=1798665 RepID=A0A1G2DCL6_9BACT|nr:MAG: hypothetical protein A3C13_00215 [Candidatus Lloydbacteria bacterium RIFCSPHIGHO2_02_FULL_50_11]OGZ11356.1 MAG: hypothetical protein A2942_04040 [Candidatus Lloydbacteria bacterium RIFCSPLOWO2_01_FULL_50_20]
MTNPGENAPEQFPTPEELKSIFERLLSGKDYTVLVSNEDHVQIETLENGERVEYDYAKAKYDYRNHALPDKSKVSASIHKTYYYGDRPGDGECVANYLDGNWEFIS